MPLRLHTHEAAFSRETGQVWTTGAGAMLGRVRALGMPLPCHILFTPARSLFNRPGPQKRRSKMGSQNHSKSKELIGEFK